MKIRLLVCVLLTVGMLPIATAQMAPENSADTSNIETNVAAQQTDEGNYTRLYVERDNSRLELQPGESDEFTVTVTNADDEPVTVTPRLHVPPAGDALLKESWVNANVDEATLAAGEEREFTVSVEVPEDAELGRYHGQIAFTDETVAYPGRPARPVHAASAYVRVWREPTVEILAGNRLYGQLEAGDSTTHDIVIKNTGDEPVPVNPDLADDRQSRCHGDCPDEMDRSWLDIDAPTQIAPGETATVSVTVTPPADVDRGDYNSQLDLGLKDPARDDRNNYWQQVRLNLQVWKQPTDPFETSFHVSDDAESVTLELGTQSSGYHYGSAAVADSKRASFDVQFVGPDGAVVEADRVELSDTGHVDMSGERRDDARSGRDYATQGTEQTHVYRLDDPEAGEWDVRIMPENTVGFSYELTRDESSE